MSHVDGVDDGVGYGVYGKSNINVGVDGESDSGYGVYGLSNSRDGVVGFGPHGSGVRGQSNDGHGVVGTSNSGFGVHGVSIDQAGVVGEGVGRLGSGIVGISYSGLGAGVVGIDNNGGDGMVAVSRGTFDGRGGSGIVAVSREKGGAGVVAVGTPDGIGLIAVSRNDHGVSARSTNRDGINSFSQNGTGVYGSSINGGAAVAGQSVNGYGVYASSGNNYAAYLDGSVYIRGPLQKPGGQFKIDHPLDPANKYLCHSFVESPDMKNVYDGVVILDKKGEAEVDLPDWFSALNKDYRYQLTAIGAPGPNLYIAKEISEPNTYKIDTAGINNNNHSSFKIAGGTSGMKVSWQVTGIRKDPWANTHRVQVEEDKPANEQGYYMHPDLYSQPAERGLSMLHFPQEIKVPLVIKNK
jgi:hypothetical protein